MFSSRRHWCCCWRSYWVFGLSLIICTSVRLLVRTFVQRGMAYRLPYVTRGSRPSLHTVGVDGNNCTLLSLETQPRFDLAHPEEVHHSRATTTTGRQAGRQAGLESLFAHHHHIYI